MPEAIETMPSTMTRRVTFFMPRQLSIQLKVEAARQEKGLNELGVEILSKHFESRDARQ